MDVRVHEAALGLRRTYEVQQVKSASYAEVEVPVDVRSLPILPERTGAHLSARVRYEYAGDERDVWGGAAALAFLPGRVHYVTADLDSFDLRVAALGDAARGQDPRNAVEAAQRAPSGLVEGERWDLQRASSLPHLLARHEGSDGTFEIPTSGEGYVGAREVDVSEGDAPLDVVASPPSAQPANTQTPCPNAQGIPSVWLTQALCLNWE